MVVAPMLAIATLPLTPLLGRRQTPPSMISMVPTLSKNNVASEKV